MSYSSEGDVNPNPKVLRDEVERQGGGKLPSIKNNNGEEGRPTRSKTHLGHHHRGARGVKPQGGVCGGLVDFESKMREDRHMKAFEKLKRDFENPKLPPLAQSHGKQQHIHLAQQGPDAVWHYKNSYGMSIERGSQTEISSTLLEPLGQQQEQPCGSRRSKADHLLGKIRHPFSQSHQNSSTVSYQYMYM